MKVIFRLALVYFCSGFFANPIFAQDSDIPRVFVPGDRCDGYVGTMKYACQNGRDTFYEAGGGSTPSTGGGGGGGSPATQEQQKPSTASDSGTSAKTCKPVILATGEKVKEEIDYVAHGAYGLGVSRMYRSKQTSGAMFGPNWMSSIEVPRVMFTLAGCSVKQTGDCIPETVTIAQPDGTKFTYKFSSIVLAAAMSSAEKTRASRARTLIKTPGKSATTMAEGDTYGSTD